NRLFLLRHRCSKFLRIALLFEKLIEQHGVDRVVRHGVDLAILIPQDQVWIRLSYFLGDQTKWRSGLIIILVAKPHRVELQQRFTRLTHRSYFRFKSRDKGGGWGAERKLQRLSPDRGELLAGYACLTKCVPYSSNKPVYPDFSSVT